MAISIVVPQLGESVAEGTVAKWLKAVGDKVRKEEPLVEIQTDKINVEIPSPADGTLAAITVAEGTTVLVGTEIGTLAGAGEAARGAGRAAAAAAAAAAACRAARAAAAHRGRRAVRAGHAAGANGNARPRAPAAAPASRCDDRNLSPAVRTTHARAERVARPSCARSPARASPGA